MILITYFSATGTTRGIAERIGQILNCDIFEIVPKIKYTDKDLNWNDKDSRTSLEMNDPSSRPEILNKIDVDKYDKIVIGFPVWWYTAPRIINTFIEENSLLDKEVYVFVTSGGSDSIQSFNNLKSKYPEINFINSKRLNEIKSEDDIKNWLQNS